MNRRDQGWEDEAVTEREVAPGARVLVVADDEDMQRLVTSELVREGYEVDEAFSGADLFRILESIAVDAWPLDGVDLIVLDLHMPAMTGLEIVRKLRAAHWQTPAILMTASAEPEVLAEAARLGVSVLPAPFALETLAHTAGALLVEHGRSDGRVARHGFPAWR